MKKENPRRRAGKEVKLLMRHGISFEMARVMVATQQQTLKLFGGSRL